MWAPVGYYWWKDISAADRSVAFGPKGLQRLFSILRKLPPWFLHLYAHHVHLHGVGRKRVQEIRKKLLPPDIHYIEKPKVYEAMIRDNLESAKQMYFGLGCNLCLITRDWGFEITDLPKVYQGPLHIWNGDQDLLVNIDLQRCIKKLFSSNSSFVCCIAHCKMVILANNFYKVVMHAFLLQTRQSNSNMASNLRIEPTG